MLTKGSRVNHVVVVRGVYRTPLLCAVEFNRLKVVEVLLSKGADIYQAQEIGVTPLSFAIRKGYLAIAELLLSKGAAVNLAPKSRLDNPPRV